MRSSYFVLAAALAAGSLHAQTPLGGYADAFETRAGARTPDIRYEVRVDTAGNRLAVVMRIDRAPDTLRIAIPRWAPGAYRVVEFASRLRNVVIRTADGERQIADSGLAAGSMWPGRGQLPFRVTGDSVEIRYEIVCDTAPNNRAFLASSGALLDGPATYLYLPGQTLAPARVRFEVPRSWRIVTGLVPTADSAAFFAPSYEVLIDSPVLMGDRRSLALRRLTVDGVVHRAAWWRRPGAAAFDTAAFVAPIPAIVEQTKRIFGWLPYREYTFLFIDGVGGGLEHLNSTTIGTPAAEFAQYPRAHVAVAAHEYFHHWNVKRIRPIALGPFDYQRITRSRSLWLSEGVTDYFANAIVRRAALVTEEEARDALAASMQDYLANPANGKLSPERSSFTAWDPPAVNRGYSLSYYLSGSLLGEILDVRLRSQHENSGGMDALMRRLRDRYAGARGFTDADIVREAGAVCGCDMRPFFARYVGGEGSLPLDDLASALGWRLVVERSPATDRDGQPVADRRIGVTPYGGAGSAGGPLGGALKLSIADPTSAWGRAGLASGDTVLAVNGEPVSSPAVFRSVIGRLAIGDSVTIRVRRGDERSYVVHLTGYERVRAHLEELPTLTAQQQRARERWLHGDREER
ncbi:MAG: M61 family metallopeptidase [Gemmatimonadaceae bacterium]|nr:M61 family metallopeptidase [Gemmatimonadaceae bacterium]